MKYQLIIKDNETGETLKSVNTDCIIFAAHKADSTASGVVCNCDPLAMADTYAGVHKALDILDKENPKLKVLAAAKSALEDVIRNKEQKKEETKTE
jgi:hypothetical protein